jgi:hypothetical protein
MVIGFVLSHFRGVPADVIERGAAARARVGDSPAAKRVRTTIPVIRVFFMMDGSPIHSYSGWMGSKAGTRCTGVPRPDG